MRRVCSRRRRAARRLTTVTTVVLLLIVERGRSECVPGDTRWLDCVAWPASLYQSCRDDGGDYKVKVDTGGCGFMSAGQQTKCLCSNEFQPCDDHGRFAVTCGNGGDPGAQCTNLDWPQYSCQCSSGYQLEGHVCVEINSCDAHKTSSGADKCASGGDSTGTCFDLPAPQVGMFCQCAEGFEDAGGVCTERYCAPLTFSENVIGVNCDEGDVLTAVTRPTCEVACAPGYAGNGETATMHCPITAISGTTASSCFRCSNEVQCDPYDLPEGVIGDVADGNPCSQPTVLRVYARPHCDVTCQEGYEGGSGRVRCGISGGPATTDLTCTERRCDAFAFPDGVEGDSLSSSPCSDGVVLTAVQSNECNLRCKSGYTTSGSGTLRCAIDGGPAETTIACARDWCGDHVDAQGVDRCKTGRPPDVDAYCSNRDGGVVCTCSDGFRPSDDDVCEEQRCAPLSSLGAHVVPDDESAVTACRAGDVLTTVTTPSCAVRCEDGYVPTSSGTPRFTCASSSTSGDDATTSFVCVENACAPFSLADGVRGDLSDGNPCADDVVLTTISRRTCMIECEEGYSDASAGGATKGNVTCAIEGGNATTSLHCVEHACAPYVFPEGVVGDVNASRSCVENVSLTAVSHAECSLRCDEGYLADGGSTLRCPIEGGTPVASLRCARNWCGDHVDAHGVDRCKTGSPPDTSARCNNRVEPLEGVDCVCGQGFRDVDGVCEQQTCAPLVFGPYVVVASSSSSSSSSCVEGTRLTTVSNTTCRVACEVGYRAVGSGYDRDTNDGTFVCASSSVDDDEATSSFVCVENACEAYELGEGVRGDLSYGNPCANRVVLSTISRRSCDVACETGYSVVVDANHTHDRSNRSATTWTGLVTCPIEGGNATSNLTCAENACAPYVFPEGVVGDANASRPCVENVSLTAVRDNECSLRCATNYLAEGSSTLRCPIEGGEAVTTFRCVPIAQNSGASDGASEDDARTYMYVGVSAGALVLIVSGVCVFSYVSKRRMRRSLHSKLERKESEMMTIRKKISQHISAVEAKERDIEMLTKAWLLEWDDLEIDAEPLASGMFGSVWRGTYRGNWEVAVKKMTNTSEVCLEEESEVRFLQRVRHRRLVQFVGAGRMPDENLFIVLEFMEEGSLDSFIERRGRAISWTLRLQIASDIVHGMAFLHEEHNSIHRDLKSANVMLSKERGALRAKIGDFGMSRFASHAGGGDEQQGGVEEKTADEGLESASSVDISMVEMFEDTTDSPMSSNSTHSPDRFVLDRTASTASAHSMSSSVKMTMTCGCGTPTHMAPEVWATIAESTDQLTKKIDVYSFAVILWELTELKKPWDFVTYSYQIGDAVESGERLELSAVEDVTDKTGAAPPPVWYKTLRRSWSQKVDDRPSFTEIRVWIDGWRASPGTSVGIVVGSAAESSSFWKERDASSPSRTDPELDFDL